LNTGEVAECTNSPFLPNWYPTAPGTGEAARSTSGRETSAVNLDGAEPDQGGGGVVLGGVVLGGVVVVGGGVVVVGGCVVVVPSPGSDRRASSAASATVISPGSAAYTEPA
jgi:hypothetical protein